MSTYLVTGAGRGIGLELTTQLAKLDSARVSKIFAITRGQPTKALTELVDASAGRAVHVFCDITVPASIEKAVALVDSELTGHGLDVLVNNVGTQSVHPNGICSMADSTLLEEFDVNVASVHRMTSALMPLLKKGNGKKIINMSTSVGSISYAPRFVMAPAPAYKVTKAALNMLTVQYALEFGKQGFTVLAISPGWLKTDMGSSYADLEVETGVQAALQLILSANPEMNGKFLNIHVPGWEEATGPNQYDGGELPW